MLAVLSLVTLSGCGAGNEAANKAKKPAPQVETDTVKVADMISTLKLTGEVVAIETAGISSNIDGPVSFCPFREGDKVEKDEKIIEIDREILKADVAAAEASLAVARAKLTDLAAGTRPEEIDKAVESIKQARESAEFASKDLEKISMLVKSGALPAEDLEKARVKQVTEETRYKTAQKQLEMLKAGVTSTAIAVQHAQVKEAEAKLKSSIARLQECIVTAPFSGTIARMYVKNGDMAVAKARLFDLTNLDSLVIRCKVPEKYATVIASETKVDAKIDALPGLLLTGSVSRIYPELDSRFRTRTIEISIDQKEYLLPGMFARLELILQKLPDVISLPEQAVRKTPEGKKIVFVPVDGKAVTRPVTTGVQIGNNIQILTGLASGETVIVAGNDKLKDGAEIRVPGKKDMTGNAGKDDKPGLNKQNNSESAVNK